MTTYLKKLPWKRRSPCCRVFMKPLNMIHSALECSKCGKKFHDDGEILREIKK